MPQSFQNENGTLVGSQASLDELNESIDLNIFFSTEDSVEVST